MNYCPALLNSCRGQSMRLMYSQQLICILTTRGGSLSSAHLFTGRASLFMCYFYFWSRGSQSDAKSFLGGTSALVYYLEGCTSCLNPAHHRQGATDLDSFSVCPASKFTPLFSLSISNGPRCRRIPSRLSLLICGIIISGSLMLMSSGWPAAKQQD